MPPQEIDWNEVQRKRVLTDDDVKKIAQLGPGRALVFGESDFGGRTPQEFRVAAINYMRNTQKIHITTRIVDGSVVISLKNQTEAKRILHEIEESEYSIDENGITIDKEGRPVIFNAKKNGVDNTEGNV